MQEKTTSQLEQELSGCADLRQYLHTNHASMHLAQLPELLQQALDTSGLSRAEALRRSGLNTIYGYQIFAGKRRPSRDSLLCLCVGMALTPEKAQALLKRAGYAPLYVRQRRDSIIFYALQEKLSMQTLNQQLYELGEPVLL